MAGMLKAFAVVPVLVASLALAQDELPKTYAEYERAQGLRCTGPVGKMAAPEKVEHQGLSYLHDGSTVSVRGKAKAKAGREIRIGVLSAIKDQDEATEKNLDAFLAAFKKRKVEVILVGGDSPDQEPRLAEALNKLAGLGVPVLTVIGNTEPRLAFNGGVRKAREAGNLNVLNMDIIRRYDGEGFDVVSLAGYHDKKFIPNAGGCLYSDDDVATLAEVTASCDDPIVLLTHGPPKMSGEAAIDFVPGVGNVGNPVLTGAMTAGKISFGVFGHILEAAGKATDLEGKVLPNNKFAPALYVNPGSASAFPWTLNDGTVSKGMAAVLTLKAKEAKVEFLTPASK